MLNKFSLSEIIIKFKQDFNSRWEKDKEYFKWQAVKHFQTNWNINANDFSGMLTDSLSKTYGLLASQNNFPAKMIEDFASAAPEEVREMFLALYNESNDVVSRIIKFKNSASVLLNKYGNGAGQHYQNENTISTYLWLRYPDKYYIYKYSEVKVVAEVLQSTYRFKKGAYTDNMKSFFLLYDEINNELRKDTELSALLKSKIDESCYPDLDLRTLTIDVGFYISRYIGQKDENTEQGKSPVSDTETELSKVEIEKLHSEAQSKKWMNAIVIVLRGLGGSASRGDVHKGIIDLFDISEDEISIKNESGGSKILNDIDWARNYLVYEGIIDKNGGTGIWSLSEVGNKIIISDQLAGMIIAKWIRIKSAIRKNKPEPIINLVEYYQFLEEENEQCEAYSRDDFLSEVYLSGDSYDTLVSVLKNKKNIILQGAPGVGKTFIARRLAYSIMGKKDEQCIEMVQFHQNYSYEDFIIGYKPVENGFELRQGVFFNFCRKAVNHPKKDFFFIIDEINRGNMSKIFGELLMVIERDYRGREIKLAYSSELSLIVPQNLYIIGMMNTADRSLAMIDYALRRRFSFFEMEPGFDSDGFVKYQKKLKNKVFDNLITKIKELNKAILSDPSLGKGFCIGHSYFCEQKSCTNEWLREVVEFDIVPMLSEYWFDENEKLQQWINQLRGVFQ